MLIGEVLKSNLIQELFIMFKPMIFSLALLTSSVCSANTDNQSVSDQQFQKWIENTRKELSRYLPIKSNKNYRLVGEESPEKLLQKLTKINRLSDICNKGFGSPKFCQKEIININYGGLINSKITNFPKFLEITNTKTKLGDDITMTLNNNEALHQSKNRAVFEIAEANSLIPNTKNNITFETWAKAYIAGMLPIIMEENKEGLENMGISLNLNEENKLEFYYFLSEIVGAFIRKLTGSFEHCQISSNTEKQIAEIINYNNNYFSKQIFDFWTTNSDTQKYSKCVEKTINKNGFLDELKIILAVRNAIKEAKKRDLTNFSIDDIPLSFIMNNLKAHINGENSLNPDTADNLEEHLKKESLKIDKALFENPNEIKIFSKRINVNNTNNTILAPDIKLPIYINGKQCNDTNEFCNKFINYMNDNDDFSDYIESAKKYASTTCKINNTDVDTVLCLQLLYLEQMISSKHIFINDGDGFVGIDYMVFLGQQISQFKSRLVPEEINIILSKFMKEQYSQKNNVKIRLKQIPKSSFFVKKNVWVVDSIDLDVSD